MILFGPADFVSPVAASGEVGWFGARGDGTAFLEFPVQTADAPSVTIRFARAGPGDEQYRIAWEIDYPIATRPGGGALLSSALLYFEAERWN